MDSKFIIILSGLLLLLATCGNPQPVDEWISLFNGKDLTGWTANENTETFKIEDGLIVANGDRSHLFYTGEIAHSEFSSFEFKAEVMTTPGSNSGIYFHTEYQEEGWPAVGYEAQVNNTHIGEGDYRELKKTGSLYGVHNIYKQLVPDDEWFDYHIKVTGDRIEIRINDILVIDYIQPVPDSLGRLKYRGKGTFALQGHDPHSTVSYRNIRVKVLEDSPETNDTQVIENDTYLTMRELMAEQHSFTDLYVDYHNNFDLEEALNFYYRTGINLGIVLDPNEHQLAEQLQKYPVFVGTNTTLRKPTPLFDYIIGPAGVFDDSNQDFQAMDSYVASIVRDLESNNLDVWSRASWLPENVMERYDQLWTPEKMQRVIDAAIANGVAIEIDNEARLPGMEFIKTARAMGAKFTYANLDINSEMGNLGYIFEVIEQCDLGYKDIFIP